MKTIGERIKRIRQELNIPQKVIADHIGVQRPNYSKIENDKQNLTPIQLKKLCEYFNVSADYILEIEVDKKKTISTYEYKAIHKALNQIHESLK